MQQLLFNDHTPPPASLPDDPMAARRRAMNAAFDHASEAFRTEYTALVMRFVAEGKEFTGQDIQETYKRRHMPLPRNWRASGGIIQGLIRKGVIVAVGTRKRNNGNLTAVYRGK